MGRNAFFGFRIYPRVEMALLSRWSIAHTSIKTVCPATMMKRTSIFIGMLALFTSVGSAAPSARTPKTDVTGTIVDYKRSSAILVLSNFAGWDRKQMGRASWTARSSTKRWFESLEKQHAVIYIKKVDFEGLRKGKRVKITGYSYFTDEWAVYPSYDKIEVLK